MNTADGELHALADAIAQAAAATSEVKRLRQRIAQLERNERTMLDALRTRRAEGEAVDWDAIGTLTDAQLRSFVKIVLRVRDQKANPAAYALRWVKENLP